ncbi:MAG TPA: hypothetical protein VFT20_12160 [Candidatus Limnocylindrales bacterium]|nr:hypothetical protein [Candidatus Limnocylindrales bacterium]
MTAPAPPCEGAALGALLGALLAPGDAAPPDEQPTIMMAPMAETATL